MNCKECKNTCADDEIKRFDAVNGERLETSRKRIARAIKILNGRGFSADVEKSKREISRAVNVLETVVQEMEWHCEWFGYDVGICLQINDAIARLGKALCAFFDDDNFEDGKFEGGLLVECDVRDALVDLSKALATLVRWNDDDVSEI